METSNVYKVVAKDPFVREISQLLQKWRHFVIFKYRNGYKNVFNKLNLTLIYLYSSSKESLFYKECKYFLNNIV